MTDNPTTPQSLRALGDAEWIKATDGYAAADRLRDAACRHHRDAIVAWAKAEVLELAKIGEQSTEAVSDHMLSVGAAKIEASIGQVSSYELAEAVYLAMIAAKP